MPSLRKMLVTWTAAVPRLMNSSVPIWALLRPATSSTGLSADWLP